ITGSLGLAPSGNINEEHDYPDMFEPDHGSAPNIVGQGIANPHASILTVAMMFKYLVDGDHAAADDLWNAVEAQLADESAPRTPDLGGDAKTGDVVSDLSDRL